MQTSESRTALIAGASERQRPAAPGHWRIPSPFIVQLAASHAGIGPYCTRFREGASVATACYRVTDMSDR
jgi:hypothetical protein